MKFPAARSTRQLKRAPFSTRDIGTARCFFSIYIYVRRQDFPIDVLIGRSVPAKASADIKKDIARIRGGKRACFY